MGDRRSDILITSRKLFNQHGFGNVTIRMIAQELKISSGNLNYHFKKREEILEALYFEMVAEFDQRINQLEGQTFTLQSIHKDIKRSMERMVDYHFFWTDLYNLLRINIKIKAHFEEAYKRRFDGYDYLFNALLKSGLLKKFEFPQEREFLIERMIDLSNNWLYTSSLYQTKIDNDYIALQANNLLSMLYPYFTHDGKEKFKEFLPNYFE